MNASFDANLSHAFYFSSTAFETESAFSNAVRRAYPDAVEYDYNNQYLQTYIQDLQTVHRFLHGGAQTYAVCRFFLQSPAPDLQAAGFCDWCAMLSFFPESGVLSLSFHFSLTDVSSDHLIVLRQSGQYRKYPFCDGKARSFSDLADEIADTLHIGGEVTEQSYLCEITKFGQYDSIPQIEAEHSDLLYGLLTGDEAYQFVPEEIIQERLVYHWGSRSFIRIYAFGQAFVFLNLIGSPDQIHYLAHQERFGTAAYGACDAYFRLGSCPLTVNHGILFAVEFVMMLKSLIDNVISYQSSFDGKLLGSFYGRIRETRDFRKRIIMVLEKTENIEITEMGELNAILLESQHISPIVERVKYLLELIESDLDLMYSERNNTLVTILTVLGLVLALVEFLLV